MESQIVEYKESWRDEYLKWICGFANAQGGKILIGVNDDGTVCGVSDAKRLIEDIPNKVKTHSPLCHMSICWKKTDWSTSRYPFLHIHSL